MYFIYLLVKELSTEHCALISAAMLAISPWAIHFSRGGWEVNVATTMLLIGTWSFIKWLKNPKFLWLGICGLGFVLSMYTYQSARVIAPLFGLGLFILYFKQLLKYPKQIFWAFLTLTLILTPLAISIFRSNAASRLSGVGLLADVGPLNRAQELRGQHANWNSSLSRLFHNRPVLYTIAFLKNYSDHFFGNFLFVNGDIIERNRVPETGLLYLTDFIFLALGAVYLLRTKDQRLETKLVWLWLLVAPVASAMTFQTPHALRAHSMVIPLVIILSFGIYSFFIDFSQSATKSILKIKNLKLLWLVVGSFMIVYVWQVARYLHEYYIHYPQTYPAAWEYGFKELVPYIESVKDRYEKILITDKYDQPYILFLFYSQYPPERFQGNHQLTVRDKFNFSTVRDYDKFHFSDTPWSKVSDIHSSLIVAAPEDIPDVGVNIVKTINFPSGRPAFKIVSN